MPAPRRTRQRSVRQPADEVIVAPNERRDAVLSVIGAARTKLILSMFRCDDPEVLKALADALRRKVKVEILLTGRAKGWHARLQRLWVLLEDMGASLHRYPNPIVKYHAKYIVADRGPALVASLNLTRECFASTVDFVVVTHDDGVVSGLTRLFHADCEWRPAPLPRGLSRRLIVGPERARKRFTALIEGARRSMCLVDPKVTDPAIVKLLKAKAAAGVRVSVRSRGTINGLTPHGRLLIVDGSTAVIGSVSLSSLSLGVSREVAIVVDDPTCLRRLKRWVGRDGKGRRARATPSRTRTVG